MAALSSSYIILTALVQNIFYIHAPYNVKDAYVMIKTDDFSTANNTWEALYYDLIDDKRTPVFKIFIPTATASSSLRYKIKFHFRNDSIGETKEWQTFITNTTTCRNSAISNPQPTFKFNTLMLAAAIVNIIVCILIILKLLYQFSRNQCIVWLK
jgi:hypothetical protein